MSARVLLIMFLLIQPVVAQEEVYREVVLEKYKLQNKIKNLILKSNEAQKNILFLEEEIKEMKERIVSIGEESQQISQSIKQNFGVFATQRIKFKAHDSSYNNIIQLQIFENWNSEFARIKQLADDLSKTKKSLIDSRKVLRNSIVFANSISIQINNEIKELDTLQSYLRTDLEKSGSDSEFFKLMGRLKWPVPKSQIIASKGFYKVPGEKVYDYNEGLKFSSERGTAVFPIASGILEGEIYVPNLGQILIVKHTENIRSFYIGATSVPGTLVNDPLSPDRQFGLVKAPVLELKLRFDTESLDPLRMGQVPEIGMYKKIGTFGLGLTIGLVLSPAISTSSQKYDFLRLYAKVFNLVESSYVENVDERKMVVNSVRGLLGGLDPYSAYLEKDDFKEFQSETLGRFGGLGIEVIMEGGFLQIISPIEDSPAEKAGIKPGDKIISIDGEVVRGLDIVEASKKLRGKVGTDINLTVKREGTAKLLNFKITRDKITIRSVKTKVLDKEKGIYYVRITSFLEQTTKDFKKFFNNTTKSDKINGLIIDLRGNPGGLLKQAVEMADLFIESGDIVSTIGRNKDQKNVLHAAKEGTLDPQIKIAILLDEGSASASEIFAAALKDHDRAKILGQKSYGKGSVQSVIPLENGDGVKLTIAKYYSPKGTVIDKKGIMPNIELKTVKEEYKLEDIEKDPWITETLKVL